MFKSRYVLLFIKNSKFHFYPFLLIFLTFFLSHLLSAVENENIKEDDKIFRVEDFVRIELLKKICSKKSIGFLIVTYIVWSYCHEFIKKKLQKFKNVIKIKDYHFVNNLEKEFNALKKIPDYWDYNKKIRKQEREQYETRPTHEGIGSEKNNRTVRLDDKEIEKKHDEKCKRSNVSTWKIIKTQLLLLVEQVQENPQCFIEILEKMEFIINQYAPGYYSRFFRKFVIPVLQSIYPEIVFDNNDLKFTTWEEQDVKYIKVVTYFLHVILHDAAVEKPLLHKKQISFLLWIVDNQNYGCIPWWTNLYQNEVLKNIINVCLARTDETHIRKKIKFFSTLFEKHYAKFAYYGVIKSRYAKFVYFNKSFFDETIIQDCLSTDEPNKIYLYKKLFKIICKNVETLFYPFTHLNVDGNYLTSKWVHYFHSLSLMINNMQAIEKKLYNTTVLSDDFNRESAQIIKSKLLSEDVCDLSKKIIGMYIKDMLFYNPKVAEEMLLTDVFYQRTDYHALIKFLMLLYNDDCLDKNIRKKVKKKTWKKIQEKCNTQKNSKGTAEHIIKNDLVLLNYLHFGFNIFKNKKDTVDELINLLVDFISDENFSNKVMSTHRDLGNYQTPARYSENYKQRINLIMHQVKKIDPECLSDTTKEKIFSISYPKLQCTYDFIISLMCWMHNIEKTCCTQKYQKNHYARFDIYTYLIKNGSFKENKLYVENYCFDNILELITQTNSYHVDLTSFKESYTRFFATFKPDTFEENERINYIHRFFGVGEYSFGGPELEKISKRNIENIYKIVL